jgi:hypothetical protein
MLSQASRAPALQSRHCWRCTPGIGDSVSGKPWHCSRAAQSRTVCAVAGLACGTGVQTQPPPGGFSGSTVPNTSSKGAGLATPGVRTRGALATAAKPAKG